MNMEFLVVLTPKLGNVSIDKHTNKLGNNSQEERGLRVSQQRC